MKIFNKIKNIMTSIQNETKTRLIKYIPQYLKDNLTIVSPFFRHNKLKASIIAGCYAGLSLIEFYAVRYFYNATESLVTGKNANDLVDQSNNLQLAVSNFCLYIITFNVKDALNGYFRFELEYAIANDFIKKTHCKKSALIGVDFIQNQEAKNNPALERLMLAPVLYNHGSQFSRGFVEIVSLCTYIPSTLMSVYYLSGVADKNLFYIGAISFGSMALINAKFIPTLEDMYTEKNETIGKAYSRIYHNQGSQIQICALNAQNHEKNIITEFQKVQFQKDVRIMRYQSIIHMANRITSAAIPVVMEYWDPSKQYIARTNIRQQSSQVVSFFVDMLNLFNNTLLQMNVAKVEILKYYRLLEQSNIIFQNKLKRQFSANSSYIEINNFTLDIPDEPNVLTTATARFPVGTKWKLTGDSGVGKSTMLKALMGMWPLATGHVNFPCKAHEVGYNVQSPVLPQDCTLLEAILYPNLQASEDEVTKLMSYLGLEKQIINLKVKANWSEILSSGQLKRIITIKAILQKVKVLLLDEPAAGLDPTNTKKLYTLIKDSMPNTTIIYIEHESSELENFMAEQIQFLKKRKADTSDIKSLNELEFNIQFLVEKLRSLRDDSFCDGYIKIVNGKLILEHRRENALPIMNGIVKDSVIDTKINLESNKIKNKIEQTTSVSTFVVEIDNEPLAPPYLNSYKSIPKLQSPKESDSPVQMNIFTL